MKEFSSKSSSMNKPSLITLEQRKNAYDQKEFHHFMADNKLSFLIRSNTICPEGFRTDFNDECLTIYSSISNRFDNKPAVALIDKTNLNIRFIRFQL